MPPKRPRARQTKINFSPASKPSPRASKPLILSDSDDDGPSPSRPSKRRRVDNNAKRGRDVGMPVRLRGRGMFGSSDVEDAPSSGQDDSEGAVKAAKVKGKKDKEARAKKARRQQILGTDSEDETQVARARKSRGKKARKEPTLEEESEEEELPAKSKKTRQSRKKGKQAEPIQLSDEEQDDEDKDEEVDESSELKEELAFLQSSPPKDRGRLRSTNMKKPRSDREKALEALKKRRAGNEPSAVTPGRKKPVIIDTDTDSDSELEIVKEEEPDEVSDEDDDGDEDDDDDTNVHDVFHETNEDENFIDDEEEGVIGAPDDDDAPTIPLAFTKFGIAKPRDLFKYAISWMVQKKINPAFSSTSEIYTIAFRKLDDEVNGLASSKYTSSVWTSDFTRAIKARPDFLANEISAGRTAIMDAHCEACNRKNHTATWEISLTGQPYHKETLEPLSSESSSDSDSDASSSLSSRASETSLNGEPPAYDALGERIPPESKSFTLGSTCKANAQVAHTLYHWRYHLNSWVVDYLVREGHCTEKKVVKRDGWSVRKREKYAKKIVDEMERTGEIKTLHKLYKDQVNFAFETKNEYKRGWGRT
ncbi:hypothetical protein P280DRAFT_464352 [Massarina eburnea CBS 473.64]|uniref:DUF4211 domain-containing protein n=1 Tax=Massarina eburnea CBS 473.64 TaxID=1395130 RepID=A0A6A6SE81_9PLEO|nr:hypothetical protein P280DRAFT_464352 [Massarina eburnea CBS 473.64]